MVSLTPRSLQGIEMMAIALVLIVIPGIVVNNLTASGLVTSSQAQTCSTNPGIPTCVLSTNVGCQANPNNCNLSGSSISFLNQASPFTQLLKGNLFALFVNLNPLAFGSTSGSQASWSGTHGPFDITGNPVFYAADCTGSAGATKDQSAWVLGRCTQTNTDNSNVTEANVATWSNWNTNWNTSVNLQFFNLGNASFVRTCNFLSQINYTALGNSGWTYFGCDITQAHLNQFPNNPTDRDWSYLIAMPVSAGAMPAGYSHQKLFVQLESWWTTKCISGTNLGPYASGQCQNFQSGFKGVSIPGSSTTFVPNSAGAIVFAFLAGIILLVGGLGLQLAPGGGVSAGINRQGTKLFQVLGIGLVIFAPMFSEFSTWFTSGFFPYGLDGLTGGIDLGLVALFFAGVMWWATNA